MSELQFIVMGEPAPQGSKKYVGQRNGHAVMVEMSKKTRPWRNDVIESARDAMKLSRWVAEDGPIRIRITFLLRRPASAPKRQLWPHRQPDLDKLVRATLDGLTIAGAITDDARVVQLSAEKIFTGPDGYTGAAITISEPREDAP